MKSKKIIGLSVFFLAVASLLYVWFQIKNLLPFGTGYGTSSELPFSSEAWKDPKRYKSEEYVRIRMIDSLLKTHQLNGKTRKEIEELLGPPHNGSYFTDWDIVYWLGPERGLVRIDSEWLCLRFQNSQVIDFALLRD